MKTLTIAGNIGKDAEVRVAGQGKVTGWTVAVDDGWGDNKRTLWIDCNWWGARGEKVAQYIRKGGKITVSGEMSTREHNDKTYITLNVSDVTLQSKSEGGYDSGPSGGGSQGGHGPIDDDLPF